MTNTQSRHAAPVSPATAVREVRIMLALGEARNLYVVGLGNKARAMETAVFTTYRLSQSAITSYRTAVEEALRASGTFAAAQ